LEKKNIYFYRQGSQVLIDYPYIKHSFPSTKTSASQNAAHDPTAATTTAATNQTPLTRFKARNSLSNLGILLLELCFGQPIEDQQLRKFYLGPDGKPHEGTDYMTARDWAEMVCEEEPALEQIIKCCISCIFEEKADWENKKFVQAVWASVCEPLERVVGKWDGDVG